MNTEVKAVPNVPPALRTLVTEAVGAASVCWREPNEDGERIFDTEQALKVADDLVAHIERAWDARESPLFAHLASLTYNLGQLRNRFDMPLADFTARLDEARRAAIAIRDRLEEGR